MSFVVLFLEYHRWQVAYNQLLIILFLQKRITLKIYTQRVEERSKGVSDQVNLNHHTAKSFIIFNKSERIIF